MPLDGHQGTLGVEGVHEDDRPAGRGDGAAEAQGRSVVERGGTEVHGVGAETVHGLEERDVRAGLLAYVAGGERGLDALGAARRTGGVEHVGAARLVFGRRGRGGGQGFLVRTIVEAETDLWAGRQLHHLGGESGERAGGDQRARAAVTDDVRRLVRREVMIDGGQIEARAHRRPVDLHDTRIIVREKSQMVAAAQACGPQMVREPQRALFELSIGEGPAAVGGDDGRPVGVVRSRVHEADAMDGPYNRSSLAAASDPVIGR